MASRTAAYGRALLKWAGRQKRKPEHVAANPFLDLTIAATEDRDRVLTEPELFEIWEAAGDLGYPFGHWIRFALLTLQRGRQECAAACWSEISADMTTWEIPGNRMKNGKSGTQYSDQAFLRTFKFAFKRSSAKNVVMRCKRRALSY